MQRETAEGLSGGGRSRGTDRPRPEPRLRWPLQRPAGSIIAIVGRNAMQRETAEAPPQWPALRRTMPVPSNRVGATDTADSRRPDDRTPQAAAQRRSGTHRTPAGRRRVTPAGRIHPTGQTVAKPTAVRRNAMQRENDAHEAPAGLCQAAPRAPGASGQGDAAAANTSDAMPCNVRTTRTKHPPPCIKLRHVSRAHQARAMPWQQTPRTQCHAT